MGIFWWAICSPVKVVSSLADLNRSGREQRRQVGLGLLQVLDLLFDAARAINIGGVAAFIWAGKVVWIVALPMILANALGGWLGSRAAISKGAPFIRVMLLVMLVALMGMTLWKAGHEFL